MIWGPTGIGKSRFGTAISFAIATEGQFLKYQPPKALRVLYIAAEMTEAELEQVIKDTIKTFPDGMELKDGPGCLNRVSASISGASAGVRLPCGRAAG